jgi:hypothetical protein
MPRHEAWNMGTSHAKPPPTRVLALDKKSEDFEPQMMSIPFEGLL